MVESIDGGVVPWELLWNAIRATYRIPIAKSFGARVAVIGPKNTGKSHVFHFIEKGALLVEAPHSSTLTAKINGWKPKLVGTNDNYLQIASYVDTVGQDSDTAGADAVGILMPDVVIIVLDGLDTTDNNTSYVREVMQALVKADERVRSKIKLIAIFVNKFDKASDREAFFNNVSSLEATAKQSGGDVFGNKCIALHTVFVKNEEFGADLATQAFVNMNDALKR